MPTAPDSLLSARRTPGQLRSRVTVDAIFDASIQVLLKDGMHRLTTTRVAERAGVSVGTLYQYYPNKRAMLFAVLERHLDGVGESVRNAAESMHGQPLAGMVDTIVRAFVHAKLDRPDEARALYAVAAELGSADIVRRTSATAIKALARMLSTASDVRFNDLELTSFMFATAMIGPTRGVVEGQAPGKLLPLLHGQLVSLCLGYLEREARHAELPDG